MNGSIGWHKARPLATVAATYDPENERIFSHDNHSRLAIYVRYTKGTVVADTSLFLRIDSALPNDASPAHEKWLSGAKAAQPDWDDECWAPVLDAALAAGAPYEIDVSQYPTNGIGAASDDTMVATVAGTVYTYCFVTDVVPGRYVRIVPRVDAVGAAVPSVALYVQPLTHT